MFCPRCGAQAPEGGKFCQKCGANMDASVGAPQQAYIPPAYQQHPGAVAQVYGGVRYAGFWLRFVALLIDSLVLGIPVGFISAIVFGLMGGAAAFHSRALVVNNPDPEAVLSSLAPFMAAFLGVIIVFGLCVTAASWLYFALMESSEKQATLGKLALNLRVTDMNGNRISFGRATARYFCKIISHFTFYIGYIMAGFTDKKQALHDMIASTLVVRKD